MVDFRKHSNEDTGEKTLEYKRLTTVDDYYYSYYYLYIKDTIVGIINKLPITSRLFPLESRNYFTDSKLNYIYLTQIIITKLIDHISNSIYHLDIILSFIYVVLLKKFMKIRSVVLVWSFSFSTNFHPHNSYIYNITL